MAFVHKAIRKLGLSDAAFGIMAPLSKNMLPEADMGAALAELNAYYADGGKSCIREQALDTSEDDLDLDIIIPCYKVESYIDVCLNSVFSQETKYRWRMIAVDDGSPDRSGEILDARAADKRLCVVHQANKGLSGARNTGLECSRARYVFFLDSDDMLCEGAIEAMLDCAYENDADMVEGAYDIINENGEYTGKKAHKDGPMEVGDCLGFAWGKLFKRRVFRDVELPVGYWYEDSIVNHILMPRVKAEGGKLWGLEKSLVRYRVNPNGITRAGVRSKKSLDALYIHLRMFEDRKKLGLVADREYYEYLLEMPALTYERTENQPEEVKRAIFTVWRSLFTGELAGLSTEKERNKKLELALRRGDYGAYSLFCALN